MTLTTEEIVEIATKVYGECDWHESTLHHLEAFAKLVAEKVEEYLAEEYMTDIHRAIKIEREACLAIAEKQRYAMNISLTSLPAQNGTAVDIANAIRARGTHE